MNKVYNGGFTPEYSVSLLKKITALVRDYVSGTRKYKAIKELNLRLKTSFIKFDVVTATFKNLVKMAVLKDRLNKTDIEKVD